MASIPSQAKPRAYVKIDRVDFFQGFYVISGRVTWHYLCLEWHLAQQYCFSSSGACEFRITALSLRMTPIHNIFYFKPNGDVFTTSI